MRTSTIALVAVIAVIAATPATAAARSSKQENIGIGAGALVGAAAGGPVGFVIGAAVGAKLGYDFDRKNRAIDSLQGSLDAAGDRASNLEGDIEQLNATIDELRDVARPELISLMQAGIAMDLLFRTNESVLASTTAERIATLGSMLSDMPGIHVQLDGFADERGDASYNQRLSEQRAGHIRDLLVASGISPDRISLAAHGESAASEPTPDSFALERRVSVKLFLADAPSLAANPD